MLQKQTLTNAYDAWLNLLPWQVALTLELNPETLRKMASSRAAPGKPSGRSSGGSLAALTIYNAEDLQQLIYQGLFRPLQQQHRGAHILALGALIAEDGNTHIHAVAYDATGKLDLAKTLDTTSEGWPQRDIRHLYGHILHPVGPAQKLYAHSSPLRFQPPELYSRPYQGNADHIRSYIAKNLQSDPQGLNTILTWGTRRLKQEFRRLAHRRAS